MATKAQQQLKPLSEKQKHYLELLRKNAEQAEAAVNNYINYLVYEYEIPRQDPHWQLDIINGEFKYITNGNGQQEGSENG